MFTVCIYAYISICILIYTLPFLVNMPSLAIPRDVQSGGTFLPIQP